MTLSWQQLHELVGVPVEDQRADSFLGISSLSEAEPGEISFLGNSRYEAQLATTKAGAVLVPEGDWEVPEGCHLIYVENPSAAFSKLIDHFRKRANEFSPGIVPGAHVAEDAELDPAQVLIGAGAVIESGVKIGRGTRIGSGCVVARNSVIGEDCFLHVNSTVREDCQLGNRVILQPGVVIGSDGYGFEFANGRHEKVAQVGIVVIEDDVEIGANSCVDRARFGRTVIGEGTKIDNLVQVGHNVRVGRHCLLVAQSGISGSVTMGNYVTIAAQAGVVGHVRIGDKAVLAARGGASKNLPGPGIYGGFPARPIGEEQRRQLGLKKIPQLMKEVRELKKKLEELGGE